MSFPGLQFWIPAILIFIPLLSCSEKPPPAAPPAPVTVAPAAQKAIPVQIQAIGNVEAFKTISVRSQITGRITKVHFTEGQDVEKGDLLLELDRRSWEAALKQAEANLARDTAQMKNAEVDAKRYARLLEKGYVSREQHDQKQTAWQALQATVQADKAVVENCRVQLDYCYIHSPLSGRTGALKIHEGNEIKANDMEITVINQIQPVNIVFSIPEKDFPELKRHMKKGQPAIEASIPGQDGIERGTLSFIDNTINPATGTITLKGVFANHNKRLWPGQFVNVVMTLTVKNDAVVVPARAVETGQKGNYVFVINPDLKAELRPVKTGPLFHDEAVILEGVAPGETVVTEGQLRLMPGTKVAIKQASRRQALGNGP